jgi:hypothetical protein
MLCSVSELLPRVPAHLCSVSGLLPIVTAYCCILYQVHVNDLWQSVNHATAVIVKMVSESQLSWTAKQLGSSSDGSPLDRKLFEVTSGINVTIIHSRALLFFCHSYKPGNEDVMCKLCAYCSTCKRCCTLDANCVSNSAIYLWSGGGLALPDFASVAVFGRMIALYSPVANWKGLVGWISKEYTFINST